MIMSGKSRYDAHVMRWWMHHKFEKTEAKATVDDVRKAADKLPLSESKLVHAVLDWLTLPQHSDGKE